MMIPAQTLARRKDWSVQFAGNLSTLLRMCLMCCGVDIPFVRTVF
ncbi:hypothetical protein LINGRAHAP2_LOCUS33620 [Linum grandiflorum]